MSQTFDRHSTADEVLADLDLDGTRVLITGASGGLGKEAARALAARGAEVILAARDSEKLAQACDDIRAQSGSDRVHGLRLDLASLQQVRAAATECLERFDRLDVLINNAGVMAAPLSRTEDGFETQFGVCHLGHFLFTCLLVPALLRAGNARVINLSSAGHRIAPVDFDDPNYEIRPYDNWQAYGQAKTANVLFSVALDRRLADQGIRSFAVHPGAIAETDLGRHLTSEDISKLMAMMPMGDESAYKSLGAGAATGVWAAVSPEMEGQGGLYLEDCQIGKPIAQGAERESTSGYMPWAVDPVAAERLWTLSERLVGQEFSW